MFVGRIGKLKAYEMLFIISTLSITPLRIFTVISTLSNTFRLTLIFIAIITFILGVLLSPRKISSKLLIVLIITYIFSTYNYYGQWRQYIGYFEKMYAYYLFFLPFLLSIFFLKYNNLQVKRALLFYILAMELITLITTLVGLQIYPNASRDLASTVALPIYKQMNIGGFEFIYGLTILIPIIAYNAKNSKRKMIYILILILSIYCILISQYSIALLVTIFIGIVSFIERIKNKNVKLVILIILFVVLIFMIILSNSIFIRFGDILSRINMQTIAQKFYDLSDSSISTYSGTVESRLYHYTASIEGFFHSPIFGRLFNASTGIGGHSEILDILASGGIILFGIVVLILYKFQFMFRLNCINVKFYKAYHLAYLSFILIALFNPILNSPVIAINTFLIPSLYINSELPEKVLLKRSGMSF